MPETQNYVCKKKHAQTNLHVQQVPHGHYQLVLMVQYMQEQLEAVSNFVINTPPVNKAHVLNGWMQWYAFKNTVLIICDDLSYVIFIVDSLFDGYNVLAHMGLL